MLKIPNLTSITSYEVAHLSFSAPTKEHPNKMRFAGTLLILDSPSDQSPHGAEGHKILVPSTLCTTSKLKDLVGMGLNYRSDLQGHQVRNKVGVITKAWIQGKAVKVKGIIWKKDFPETVKDIKGRKLGMSMELANVRVRDKDEEVWHLEDLTFTGATTLWPKSAAYHNTALAASAASGEKGSSTMAKEKDKQKVKKPVATVQASVSEIQAAFSTALEPVVTLLKDNKKATEKVMNMLSLAAEANDNDEDDVEEIAASALEEVEEVTDEDLTAGSEKRTAKPDVEAAEAASSSESESESKEDEEEDDEDMDSAASQSDEEVKAEESASSSTEKPAKKTKMKAAKEVKLPTVKAAGNNKVIKTLQAQSDLIKTLRARGIKSEKRIVRLNAKVETMTAQMDKYAEQIDRVTLPGDVSMLLNKGGYDASEMLASGRKLLINEVDELLAGYNMDVVEKMKFKNDLYEKGLLERGDVQRSYNRSN